MANIIKPKRSNTAAKVPTTTELISGELGVNMADRKVYINNGTAVVQVGAGNLSGLGDVAIATPTNGQALTYNSTTSKWQNSSAGTGTVTSVGITPGTGVTVSGSPVTTSGNIAVGLSTKLTAIENLSGAGFITQNGTGVIAGRTLQAGTGISIAHGNGSSQDPIITNSAPDQTVALTGAGATSISGTYPNFTITSVNTTYSAATSTVPGLIELGSDTAQTVAANAVSATASRSYALQVNAAGQGVVNVPWTDTNSGGTVTSVAVSGGTTGLTTSGGPITTSGTITLAGTLAVANGGTGATTAATARTNLGATTLGGNLYTLANVAAIAFPRFNADNTVSSLDAASFRTAIGAGTSSTTGTVTSVSGTGTASGLSLSGTVTTSGSLTLSGTVNSLAAGTYAISISGNAATVTNGVYTNTSQRISGSKQFDNSNTGIANSGGGLAALEAYGTGGAAFMAFHRPGVYAAYFGLDSDNVWKVGGWSTGAVAYPILHSNNYNSYSPTLTGGGASGTWGINVTGTSANVTGTVAVANGGTGSTTAAGALTNLGAYAASNPSGYITTAGARSAVSFTAGSGAYNSTTGVFTIPTNTNQLTNGAGFVTSSGVTSVSGTGTVSGLTLSGTVTSTGSLTLGGNLSITADMIYNSFTATAAQTTFTTTNTYTSGKIDVFVNGVKMVNGSDVTVTSGTSVVMAAGLPVGTRVDLVYPI